MSFAHVYLDQQLIIQYPMLRLVQYNAESEAIFFVGRHLIKPYLMLPLKFLCSILVLILCELSVIAKLFAARVAVAKAMQVLCLTSA